MQTILIVLFIARCAFCLTGTGYYAVKDEAGKVGGQICALLFNAALLLGVIYYY